MTRDQIQAIAQADRKYQQGLIPAWQYYRAIVNSFRPELPKWEVERIENEVNRNIH